MYEDVTDFRGQLHHKHQGGDAIPTYSWQVIYIIKTIKIFMNVSKSPNSKGFTLVETIVYIAIASIFFAISIGFYWQMREGDIKVGIRREIKENISQAVESFKYFTRNAEDVDVGGSQFGINPGVLVLTYPDGAVVFDTYTKNVSVGERQVEIRKLRYTQNGNSYDISSDHVDVTDYKLSDMAAGDEPEAVQMELTISSINPNDNPDYENSLAVRTTVNIRKEI